MTLAVGEVNHFCYVYQEAMDEKRSIRFYGIDWAFNIKERITPTTWSLRLWGRTATYARRKNVISVL